MSDKIQPLPGQLDIETELEKNGKRTRLHQRSVHRRISRTRKEGVASSPSGESPKPGFCGFARFTNADRLSPKNGRKLR